MTRTVTNRKIWFPLLGLLVAASAQGKVGYACLLNDKEICGLNGRDHFPMQSVYKLPIAMAMLNAVEKGTFSLDQPIHFLPSDLISKDLRSPLRDAHPGANIDLPLQELLRLAVSESDGVASDILLRLLGGPAAADRYLRHLGIEGLKIADTEKTLSLDITAQYRNYATPVAMVTIFQLLSEKSPLSSEHTSLLMKWMKETPTGANRLRALLPPGTIVAHKTGTSGTQNGITNATNDAGIITLPDGRHLCIAVFVSDSSETASVREATIAKVALSVWNRVTLAHGQPKI